MTWPSQRQSATARITELDAVRGLAAMAVVLFHFTTHYEQVFGHTGSLPVSIDWGHYGVELFFMLSGYVILMSLQRSERASHFVWGRFTRLYPTYWAAAACTFIVVTCFGVPGQAVSLGDAVLNATLIQSLLGARHIDPAYWSLQAELIFYANMLLLYRCGALKRPVTTVVCWLVAALACNAAIRWAAFESDLAFRLLRELRTLLSFQYIGLFGVGMLLRAQANRVAKAAAIAGCFVTLSLLEGVAVLPVYLGLAGIFAAASSGWLPWLGWKPLVWLGAISYPIYLIHQNIGHVVIHQLEAAGASPLLAIAAATLLSLLLASWLHRGVEVPSLKALRSIDPNAPFGQRSAEPSQAT